MVTQRIVTLGPLSRDKRGDGGGGVDVMYEPTFPASLSRTLRPEYYTTAERALVISACLSTEIAPISLMLSAPSVKFAVCLSTKTVEAT